MGNMLVLDIKRELFPLSGLSQNLNFILDKHTKYNSNFSKSILNLLRMIITNSPNVSHEEFDLTLVSTLELRQHHLEHIRKTVSKDIGLLLTRIDMQAILIELSDALKMTSPLKLNSIIISIINATVQTSNKKKLTIIPLLYSVQNQMYNATNSTSYTSFGFDSKYVVSGLIDGCSEYLTNYL